MQLTLSSIQRDKLIGNVGKGSFVLGFVHSVLGDMFNFVDFGVFGNTYSAGCSIFL